MESRKIFIFSILVIVTGLIAFPAMADETVPIHPSVPFDPYVPPRVTLELPLLHEADSTAFEQGGLHSLRMEEPLAEPTLPSLPASVHVNDITGRIVNLGQAPVFVLMFVGDAQSLQEGILDEAVLAGLIMPGRSKDASELITTKGRDLLSRDLVDALIGMDVRAVLVFLSARPVWGIFDGMEYSVDFGF